MIHQQTLNELSEEEYLLLFAVGGHIFQKIGLECKREWLRMLRVDQLIPIIERVSNLKEEYLPVKDSLLFKLRSSVS